MDISCTFEQIGQWHGIFPSNGTAKSGRYDESNLCVKGLGFDKWAVVANIIPDEPIQKYLDRGMTHEAIVRGCITFLNKPPTKRARKPKYGTLVCRHYNILGDKISASLLTTEKNNKYFWGRGAKSRHSRKVSKRGRPRKKK